MHCFFTLYDQTLCCEGSEQPALCRFGCDSDVIFLFNHLVRYYDIKPGLFMNYMKLLIILLFFSALEDDELSFYKQ